MASLFLLSGLIKCKTCNGSFTSQYTKSVQFTFSGRL